METLNKKAKLSEKTEPLDLKADETEPEFKIGSIVSVNQEGINRTVRQCEEVRPLIKAFLKDYTAFFQTTVENEQFHLIIDIGINSLIQEYERIENEKLTIPWQKAGLKEFVLKASKSLQAQLNAISNHVRTINTRIIGEPFEWSDLSIEGDEIKVDLEAIAERYTYRIEKDAQLELLVEMRAAKQHWDRVMMIAADNGYQTKNWPVVGPGRFFQVDKDGSLFLEPLAITLI